MFPVTIHTKIGMTETDLPVLYGLLFCFCLGPGECSLGNIILWGMLIGSSTVEAMIAWLYACHYSIPTLGELFLVSYMMSPYTDIGIYSWSGRLLYLLTTMINKRLGKQPLVFGFIVRCVCLCAIR